MATVDVAPVFHAARHNKHHANLKNKENKSAHKLHKHSAEHSQQRKHKHGKYSLVVVPNGDADAEGASKQSGEAPVAAHKGRAKPRFSQYTMWKRNYAFAKKHLDRGLVFSPGQQRLIIQRAVNDPYVHGELNNKTGKYEPFETRTVQFAKPMMAMTVYAAQEAVGRCMSRALLIQRHRAEQQKVCWERKKAKAEANEKPFTERDPTKKLSRCRADDFLHMFKNMCDDHDPEVWNQYQHLVKTMGLSAAAAREYRRDNPEKVAAKKAAKKAAAAQLKAQRRFNREHPGDEMPMSEDDDDDDASETHAEQKSNE
jgi:hypothetical protein